MPAASPLTAAGLKCTVGRTEEGTMRCPDCNKFVPYNVDEEPEEQSAEIEDGIFYGAFRRVLTCEECGAELKEALIEVEQDLKVGECPRNGEHDWEIDVSAEPTEDVNTVDRRGKKITNPRYMARLFGVQVTGTATCNECEAKVEIDCENAEQASSFDELV